MSNKSNILKTKSLCIEHIVEREKSYGKLIDANDKFTEICNPRDMATESFSML